MNYHFLSLSQIAGLMLVLFTVQLNAQQADSKSKSLMSDMHKVTGDYGDLWQKKDVQFDYLYDNFAAGKDVSQERFIIDGEHTWARYTTHERNVLPGQGKELDFSSWIPESFEFRENCDLSLEANEVNHIRATLAKTNGKVFGPGGAAEHLKINPKTLVSRMDRLGIKRK